ncbi:MAG TPA: LLM class F420-dependent oxidoreductase [Kineosporiaceae bacterium]|nr:LLM class F420-dependent oxidoreductase [Kineosporiaceae bacterium]
MKLGLHLPRLTYPGGAPTLGRDLADIVATAEAAGFDRISVMDHVWQIGPHGPVEQDMLEAYTTLGFLAAHTSRVKLLTLVTGVTYRDPGLLAKMVTTLDVLSGGRAMLGIGAAWNGEESEGLGLFFPSTAERFERLEETLQICLQMWAEDEKPYHGEHYRLGRTLNSPQPLTRPHPPILIGGGGEKKTLRLVAQYAQACNLFPGPELPHKLDVLRGHCERLGRDYAEIEKTAVFTFDPGPDGERVNETIAGLRELADLGIQVAHGRVEQVHDLRRLQVLGEQVLPVVADW